MKKLFTHLVKRVKDLYDCTFLLLSDLNCIFFIYGSQSFDVYRATNISQEQPLLLIYDHTYPKAGLGSQRFHFAEISTTELKKLSQMKQRYIMLSVLQKFQTLL